MPSFILEKFEHESQQFFSDKNSALGNFLRI